MSTPTCGLELRRDEVRRQGWNGIDYVEVVDPARQDTLCVHFLGTAPAGLTTANVVVEGGVRETSIRVVRLHLEEAAAPDEDDCLQVQVDRPGDFSTYVLKLVDAEHGRPTDRPLTGFDPRYARAEFSFKSGCPSDLDCDAAPIEAAPERTEPENHYLAKDYASFRQLIVDRLTLLMPDWRERHIPDVGTAIIDVLAHVGDQLSYLQDAVGTEAYLETARQRISVRRHARLVDYTMHEGCNARAWINVEVSADTKLAPAEVFFAAGLDRSVVGGRSPVCAADLPADPSLSYEVFEPLEFGPRAELVWFAAHNTIRLHTWGNRLCCLPRGATGATLQDDWADTVATPPASGHRPRQLRLEKGDFLVFEETISPRTGSPADADPRRRWVVRLTKVTPGEDKLLQQPIVEIEWAAADALPFPLHLSTRLPAPDCRFIDNLSVAHGNVVLVDHGRTLDAWEELGRVPAGAFVGECACEGSVIEGARAPEPVEFVLPHAPLTFCAPLPATPLAPAASLLVQNPRHALPQIELRGIPAAPSQLEPLFTAADLRDASALVGPLRDAADDRLRRLHGLLSPATRALLATATDIGPLPAGLVAALSADLHALLETWTVRADLLASDGSDRHFVVETDNEARVHLRFGNGDTGRRPEAGSVFLVRYRTDCGPAGNVGSGMITTLVLRHTRLSGGELHPRNPLPAQGGTIPEPMAEVKLYAPGAFRKERLRAITAADYAELAEKHDRIGAARADLRWTGSWYEAQVAIDPLGSEALEDELKTSIEQCLNRSRRIGHDVSVSPAHYVPLDIALRVRIRPHYLRGHVQSALREALSNRRLADGRLGFFHPDNLSFGNGIAVSRLIAAVQQIAGVETVEIVRLQRLGEDANFEVENGLLPLRPLEIAQLDNDPNFPERGRLDLTLEGGR